MAILTAHNQTGAVAAVAAGPCYLCDRVVLGDAACSDCIGLLASELRRGEAGAVHGRFAARRALGRL